MAGLLPFQLKPASQWMLPCFQSKLSEKWLSIQEGNRSRQVSRNLSLLNKNLGFQCQLNTSTNNHLANGNRENEGKLVPNIARGGGVSAEKPHIPVLLSEVSSFFKDKSLRVFLDGTVGAGGHSAAILEEHSEMQHYIGLDVDPLAHSLARQRLQAVLEDRREHSSNGIMLLKRRQTELHLVQSNFDRASEVLTNMGLFPGQVNGMLLDIGVSSMQVDEAERGFSFMQDGPIDMRMNPTGPLSASDIVNSWGEAEIGRILRDYGEERRWRHIARRIVEARLEGQIGSTRQLVGIVGGGTFMPRKTGKKGRPGLGLHPATRTFQALRIAANDELGALSRAIPKAIESLARGGRLAIISFHSLEDRIVKRAFLEAAKGPIGGGGHEEEKSSSHLHVPGKTRYSKYRSKREVREGIVGGGKGNVRLEGEEEKEDDEEDDEEDEEDMSGPEVEIRILTKRPITATEEEMKMNPRSRSAKLRVLEKV